MEGLKRPKREDFIRRYGFEGDRIWRLELLKYEENKSARENYEKTLKAQAQRAREEKKHTKEERRRTIKPAEKKVIVVEVRKPRPNPFAGADDIYVTKNKIAVTKTKKASAKRGYTKTTQTKYYEKNSDNLKLLKAVQGDTVREGRKGTGYAKI